MNKSAVSATGALVAAKGVAVSFGGRQVLSRVDVTVAPGEIVTLIGPNGAGKTTLVRVVLGLLKPEHGRVVRRPGLRIGYVPQRLQIDPTMPMTVGRFLSLGIPRSDIGHGRRLRALEEVGAAATMESPMSGISGGEFQRVLLARALLRDPELLVLDEPVQGVDIGGQADLFQLIGRIRDERHLGVLLVSHDLHLVMAATDRVLCINQHVCCVGTPAAVSRDPAFVSMFGAKVAAEMAVYHHHHDHAHDAAGNVVPLGGEGGELCEHDHPHDHAHGHTQAKHGHGHG